MELITLLFEYQHFFGHIAKPKSKSQESHLSLGVAVGGRWGVPAKSRGKVLNVGKREELEHFHSSLYIHP